MAHQAVSSISHYYIVVGLSSNVVMETMMIEGYHFQDVYSYLLDNASKDPSLQVRYPFITNVMKNLVEIYSKQYEVEPNLNNFRNLLDHSGEFGSNYIKVVEQPKETIITACSYYQNNRKVISLKPSHLLAAAAPVNTAAAPAPDNNEPKQLLQLKAKVAIKKKI